jgi:hypothetical protein
MQKFIARSNVQHFEKLLANETDEARRRFLEKMLSEERAKLDDLMGAGGLSAAPQHDASSEQQ